MPYWKECCLFCEQSCCRDAPTQVHPECMAPSLRLGDAGPLIPATDERLQFVGRCAVSGTDLEYNQCSATLRFVVRGPATQVALGARARVVLCADRSRASTHVSACTRVCR